MKVWTAARATFGSSDPGSFKMLRSFRPAPRFSSAVHNSARLGEIGMARASSSPTNSARLGPGAKAPALQRYGAFGASDFGGNLLGRPASGVQPADLGVILLAEVRGRASLGPRAGGDRLLDDVGTGMVV